MKVWIVVLFTVSALVPLARAGTTPKNVLILSGGRGRVSINQMEAALRAHFSEPVNFSIVDLDNPRFEQKSYQDNLAEALRAGYSNEKLDLVVAVMTVALRFAVQYHDKLFPGVPIVFMRQPLPTRRLGRCSGRLNSPSTSSLSLLPMWHRMAHIM